MTFNWLRDNVEVLHCVKRDCHRRVYQLGGGGEREEGGGRRVDGGGRKMDGGGWMEEGGGWREEGG